VATIKTKIIDILNHLEFLFSQITKFSQKKRLHNREIWQYFQKSKVKMWSLENQKRK
jgi:hypothetical protein